MKKFIILPIFFTLISFALSADGFSVTDMNSTFKIKFPAQPNIAKEEPAEKNNFNEITGFTFEDKENKRTYYALATHLSEKNKPDFPDAMYLDQLAEMYHNKWGAENASKNVININGQRGYELRFSVNPKYDMRANIYFENGVIYEILLVAFPADLDNADAIDFFNSFQILVK